MSLTLRVNGKDFHLANVYIPPERSCPRGYTPGDFSGLNANRTLVLGNFNAHDRTWYYNQAEDRRGSHLLEQFEEMVILNDPYSPTRRPRRVGERATAPDITFCSHDISPLVQWKVVPDLSSDHNPILVDIARWRSLPLTLSVNDMISLVLFIGKLAKVLAVVLVTGTSLDTIASRPPSPSPFGRSTLIVV